MKLFSTQQTRAEYLDTQISRSESKFNYCKVSADDVSRYRTVLQQAAARSHTSPSGPVVCLGTRNGREIDLFRTEWFGGRILRATVRRLERRTTSYTSWLPLVESVHRSDARELTARNVVGVEINPRAARRDVWVGSFDAMPREWDRAFEVVYSNSFDQCEEPERTAQEWKRVLKPGGFLIFCFTNDAEPSLEDRVGGLSLSNVQALFGGRLIYSHDAGSANGYSEAILQI